MSELRSSKIEQLMIEVLKASAQSLNMAEIAAAIKKKDNQVLTGKTPDKSLYSIIYRREAKRKELGLPSPFVVIKRGGGKHYELNKEAK